MATLLGALRKTVLAPSMDDVGFAARGFRPASSPMARHLESIPQHVVLGFEFGIEASTVAETVLRVEMVSDEFRGFAYEGAAMAFTILDSVTPKPGDRLVRLLSGPAAPHVLLSYIGVGFAMARLPRRLWGRILPDLSEIPQDPTLSWLVVDGYGFDLAYFNPGRYVGRQVVPPDHPWLGDADYFHHAVDQGIGRALWFIHGAEVPAVAAAVASFPVARTADLWSGVGLAATYAGAAGAGGADMLRALRSAAGRNLPELAQGAVFAAKARVHGGLTTEHTETATATLCGMTAADAAGLADREAPDGASDGLPAYEVWRRRLQTHFPALVDDSHRS
jgi:hypothetical protein